VTGQLVRLPLEAGCRRLVLRQAMKECEERTGRLSLAAKRFQVASVSVL